MLKQIEPSILKGTILAPASKSSMQRACAAALLHVGKTVIHHPGHSNDDKAALGVIRDLGAKVTLLEDGALLVESEGVRTGKPGAAAGAVAGEGGKAGSSAGYGDAAQAVVAVGGVVAGGMAAGGVGAVGGVVAGGTAAGAGTGGAAAGAGTVAAVAGGGEVAAAAAETGTVAGGGEVAEAAGETGRELQVNCGESGLGLRMFAPIFGLSGRKVMVRGEGSLVTRPMDFFDEIFPLLDIRVVSNKGRLPLEIEGPLQPKSITIDGSLSSQFLTGLLLAYAAAGAKDVTITVNDLKSKPYIDLTLAVMKVFGWEVENRNYEAFGFTGSRGADGRDVAYTVEGDWSGGAFLLVAGAIAGPILVKGLDVASTQADKEILKAIRDSGALLEIGADGMKVGPAIGAGSKSDDGVGPAGKVSADGVGVEGGTTGTGGIGSARTVAGGDAGTAGGPAGKAAAGGVGMAGGSAGTGLKAFVFDATDCPDLFPPLVALASYCAGTTVIKGVSRLAHKESNRGLTLQDEFGKMGVKIELDGDIMRIYGGEGVNGATVHSRHDHRIAMACAVGALKAKGAVRIEEAEAINKSYPDFYEHLALLGATVSGGEKQVGATI